MTMMTPSNLSVNQRDIVWLEITYSDLSNSKIRPGLILSKNSYHTTRYDVICCAITSQERTDCCIPIDNTDIEDGNPFKKNNRVRFDWILKVDKSLIKNKIGILNEQKTQEIIDAIQDLIMIE